MFIIYANLLLIQNCFSMVLKFKEQQNILVHYFLSVFENVDQLFMFCMFFTSMVSVYLLCLSKLLKLPSLSEPCAYFLITLLFNKLQSYARSYNIIVLEHVQPDRTVVGIALNIQIYSRIDILKKLNLYSVTMVFSLSITLQRWLITC